LEEYDARGNHRKTDGTDSSSKRDVSNLVEYQFRGDREQVETGL
jgi:hypothetical protein